MEIINLCNKIINVNNYNISELLKENIYSSIIEKIYLIPKKIDKNSIEAKLKETNYINKILNTINYYKDKNIEELIKSKINQYELETSYKIDGGKLYVIIGLDTTTIYSTKIDNKDITVLLLESTDGIESSLDILLAHEYTHFVRKQIFNKDIFENSIGERFITEGIGCNYSREVVPGKEDYEYCIVKEEIVNWVKDNIDKLEKHMKNKVDTNELMSDYFYMHSNPEVTGLPSRTGYVYGYLYVKNYLEKNNVTIKDILAKEWYEIFR